MTTIIQSLQFGLSRSKTDRHAFILSHVGDIIALNLVKQAPRGVGNPADILQLADVLQGSGLKGYAGACAPLVDSLDGKRRTVADWEDARSMGAMIAGELFAKQAPKAPGESKPKAGKAPAQKSVAFTAQDVCARIAGGEFTADELKAIQTAMRALAERAAPMAPAVPVAA